MRYLEWREDTDDARAASAALGALPAGQFARLPVRDDYHEDLIWTFLFNCFSINSYAIHTD